MAQMPRPGSSGIDAHEKVLPKLLAIEKLEKD
jgi:hypothetical protein